MVVHIHQTYFYGIRQMGMNDGSWIDKINPTFIAHTAMAIRRCLSARKTGKIRVPPGVRPGGGVQCKCDTRNIHHGVNNVCRDELCHLNADFRSSEAGVQTKNIHSIHSMIGRRINSTGRDPAMAQPHNDRGSIDENFLDYILEKLIERPDTSSNGLSSFAAATEASMRFSADLPIGGTAIASSSQPVPCINSDSNSNNITNMTSIENTELVDGSTIVQGAILLAA